MKVILLKDVRKVGQHGTIVEVPDGYAINYLLPGKLGELATPDKIARIQATHAASQQEKAQQEELAAAHVRSLSGARIEIMARTTPKGGLFKSIGAAEIATAIQTQKKVSVLVSDIVLAQPIKTAGEQHILLQHGSAKSEIVVSIVANG